MFWIYDLKIEDTIHDNARDERDIKEEISKRMKTVTDVYRKWY
jgi:hypothetical protein